MAIRDPLYWVPVKYKLALMYVVLCLLAFGAGSYLMSDSAEKALEHEILERLELQSRTYATALDRHLQLLTRRTEDFASDGYIRDHAQALLAELDERKAARLRQELKSHLLNNKLPLVDAFLDLMLVSEAGEVLLAAREMPTREVAHALSRSWVEDGPWSSDLLLTVGENPRFAIATPLRSLQGGERMAHLVAWVHPGVWIVGALRAANMGVADEEASPALCLVDSAGRSLRVARELTLLGGPPVDSERVRSGFGLELAELPSGDPREPVCTPAAEAQDLFARSFPIAANRWSVHVELRSQDALAPVAGLQSHFLLVSASLLVVVSLMLFFPMRFIVRPLLLLAEATRRIKDGDFSARVRIDSTDEIGELARSFNLMSEALEERTSRLESSATDLRKRQQELRFERDRLNAVISSMWDGLVVLDSDGRPVVHNEAAGPLLELIHSDDGKATAHHMCERTDAGARDCKACLFDLSAAPRSCVIDIDGGVYEVHSTRLTHDERGRSGIVLVSRDISDRVAQDERQIHQERLAVLGEVAAVMAHELNNPLAAISMYNQMLRSELNDDSLLQENVEVIQRNTETCTRAIRELLDYATDVTPELVDVDVSGTLSDVATFLRPLRKRSEVELSMDFSKGATEVTGDEVQIREIFVNLIVNAIQAIDGRGGRVSVESSVDGEHVVVDITDSGRGIPADVREKIFRPFYTTKARGEGTGLGLPTSRRIAVMHGGGLELIESKPGRTTFRVRLRARAEGVASVDPS